MKASLQRLTHRGLDIPLAADKGRQYDQAIAKNLASLATLHRGLMMVGRSYGMGNAGKDWMAEVTIP